MESIPVPQRVTHAINDGEIGEEINRTGITITRTVQVGVICSMEQAQALAELIQRTIKQYEAIKRQKQESGKQEP